MRISSIAALFVVGICSASLQAAGWSAGFAKVAITPKQSMWMSGYAARTGPSEGTEHDLWAKAMVLRDGQGQTAVMVTLDLVGIERATSQNVVRAIAEKHKLARESVVISISHTHCGPVVRNNLETMYFLNAEEAKKVADYTEELPKLIAKAVDDAFASLQPVELSWSTGTAGFAVNRRENKEADVPALREKGMLKGPVDHDVPVLAARTADGKLVGVVFGYACHATVLSYQKWCGDYPGFAMIEVEKAHPGAVAMFFAGCGADQNPIPRRGLELAKQYGKQLADAVNAVLAKPMEPLPAHWQGTYNEIALPLKEIPTREALIKDTTNTNKYIASRARALLKTLEQGGTLPETYPYPVQTWRLGRQLTLITLGGEVVVDYALRLKKELTPDKTWIMGYANDVMAYIPSLRVLNEGGYEGDTSMIYYGLPSVWGTKVEELIVAEVHQQVKTLLASQGNSYLDFVRQYAATLRAKDAPPKDRAAWEEQKQSLRKHLASAWGQPATTPCPLEPQSHGTLDRDGYTVEKVTFQTMPGVRMTANVYVPKKAGPHPALLHVHGHWRGAKQDPTVQRRCIGAAKLGFLVMVVDAFGAGERAIGTALGEYHGEMTAATLLPVGLPLSGLQVYENQRAVDYLLTRQDVDAKRIGVSGASGGGNQTMYAAAWDERLGAAVPVCSVGNYQSYLGAACCMCEVVPGALRFTEESGILGMTAPRALMVINASKDSRQFSIAEAKKSLAGAQPIYDLYGKPESLRHATFESPHDYNEAMREAMYGWMSLHLKKEGRGEPIAEPSHQPEDPETLRCYPGDTRPSNWLTIPQFAALKAQEILHDRAAPTDREQWNTQRNVLLDRLQGDTLAIKENLPSGSTNPRAVTGQGHTSISYTPETGLRLRGAVDAAKKPGRMVLVLNCEDGLKVSQGALATEARKRGLRVATLELRATGEMAVARDQVGKAPDHNSAEWGLWIGRPLLGQWVIDVRRYLDALKELDLLPEEGVTVIGEGPAGLVALCAAATDSRIQQVGMVGTLASYVTETPYTNQRLGIMVPGIMRDIGDVAHLAALVAPRPVVIAGGVLGDGKPLDAKGLSAKYAFAEIVWKTHQAADALRILDSRNPADIWNALP